MYFSIVLYDSYIKILYLITKIIEQQSVALFSILDLIFLDITFLSILTLSLLWLELPIQKPSTL